MTGLKTRKEREDRKSLMRQLKEFWTKLSTKEETRPYRSAFTTISKQRPCWGKKHYLEVYKKRRLETAEKAKETSAHSQAACSSTEICSTVQKPHCGRMGWFSFFGRMSPIFVSAAQSNLWYCLGFSGEQGSSSISGLKKFKMDHMGRNDRPRSQWDTSFTPRTDFDCRLLHQQHIRSLSFTV